MSYLYASTKVMELVQNVELYDKDVEPAGFHDFVINIIADSNSLFSVRNYSESTENNENVFVNIAFDTAYMNQRFCGLFSTMPSSDPRLISVPGTGAGGQNWNSNVFNTISDAPNGTVLGRRFLEIAAIKIFGSAYATAAIRNDADFSLPASAGNSIYNQITTKIVTDDLVGSDLAFDGSARLNMFNAYVQLNRYQTTSNDDETVARDFNFQDTIWEFPVTIRGNVFDSEDSQLPNYQPASTYGRSVNYADNTTVLLRFISQ
jgi:hypothetical protein